MRATSTFLTAAGVALLLGVLTVHAPAWAAVLKGPGPGYYDAKDLRGPAAPAVWAYMSKAYVPCVGRNGEDGTCNLKASTESLKVAYAGDYAVAYLVVGDDMTANHPSLNRVALFRKAGDGYILVGAKDNATGLLSSLRPEKALPDGVQGPNDAFCCPTKHVAYAVRTVAGRVTVVAVARHRS